MSVGVVTTLAGIALPGYLDGIGTTALFSHPTALALHPTGVLFVTDSANGAIRTVTVSSGYHRSNSRFLY